MRNALRRGSLLWILVMWASYLAALLAAGARLWAVLVPGWLVGTAAAMMSSKPGSES